MSGGAANIVITGVGGAANVSITGVGGAANIVIASPVSTEAPSLVAAPVLSGSTEVGNTVSCSEGTWEGNPTPTYSYQWKRDGVNISGATSNTYTTVVADIGTELTCEVTATNVVDSASATTAALTITGDAYYFTAIEPLEADALFHLPLQETSGAVAVDSTPLGNDGSYEDGPLLAQSATPLPPYPLYVDLDGGTIEVPGIDLSGTAPWSVSVWCRFDAGSPNGAIWSLSDGTRDQEIRLLWLAGSLVFQREVIAARSIVYGSFVPGNDNHVIVTYDGANLNMYVNGASVGSISDSSAIDTPTTPFTFNSGSIFGAVAGLVLAGVTLFDRALTPSEVSDIYDAGVA